MPLLDASSCVLLLIDYQARLMPAIADAEATLANARRLSEAAAILGIPRIVTEQYPQGLGNTVEALAGACEGGAFVKTSFGACAEPGFFDLLPADKHVVVAGCETHVCLLQTTLGLLQHGRTVSVVADASSSRTAESRRLGIERMAAHGAQIVSTEMALFEWLGACTHPAFKAVLKLVK